MFLEDIVRQIGQQTCWKVGVGILVEYPLSPFRQTVAGRFFGKWGRQYRGVYNLRKVSVVLLVENNQHKSTISSAAKIYWKKWCKSRVKEKYLFSARQIEINSSFTKVDEQIAVCDSQGTDQNSNRLIFDVYVSNLEAQVLDVNTQMIDIFFLMQCARALRNELEAKEINVIDFEFLAYYDDLEWLAERFPWYIPKPFKKQVRLYHKQKAKNDKSDIKHQLDMNTDKLQKKLLKNDLCEANDRLHPRCRFIWRLFHYSKYLIAAVIPHLVIAFVAFSVGISDLFLPVTFASTLGLLLWIAILILRGKRIYKFLIKWHEKLSQKYLYIEESRSRKFKEYYVSKNCQIEKSILNTLPSPKQRKK